jgi:hypothetical protein
MSELITNKLTPGSGSSDTVTMGDSGDTFNFPSGVTVTANAGATVSGFGISSSDQSVCKAWVNFNGTGTVAIRDSFNVGSITDSGTGKYLVNFSSSLANANYAPVVSGHSNTADDGGSTRVYSRRLAPTTSQFGLVGLSSGDARGDTAYCFAVVFGDNA